ncbi:hypothetical protein L21SP3_01665 [Sedimentisphaera cyanobacteriorum]|uniref:Uncharacterized protein n=1 Tax=Sedimentisphaera cyanobacteriorum TaxID=1940790 RepID=A0A1Q2HRH2_9BACT|nr:hypothetical protein L21SP3_01665 [Sedimentisphaera cyanobacteriorum]
MVLHAIKQIVQTPGQFVYRGNCGCRINGNNRRKFVFVKYNGYTKLVAIKIGDGHAGYEKN